jgi:nucleoside-diphosphate-sugar epimerase
MGASMLDSFLQINQKRIVVLYGPRETHPYIVPEIIGQLSVSSYLSLGNLEAKRDFTYVDDIVAALDSLLWIPAETPRANVERDTCLGLIKLQGRIRSWPQY